MRRIFLISVMLLYSLSIAFGQANITGVILDASNNEPIPFANIIVTGTNTGTTSYENGEFLLTNVSPGYKSLTVTFVGFEQKTTNEIFVTVDKAPYIEIKLNPSSTELEEVVISKSKFEKKMESPLSIQTIGVKQIEKSPGANRDISKVIQSLPGVGFSTSFRNDIIIRGGSPSENRFFLDGIEVPIINHFQTQGASGGPVGIINVDFLSEVDFYSGAFPSNRPNGISSILDFKQREGNHKKLNLRITGGSSDFGIASEGPISKNTTFIASVRQSYLQLLFKALKLPFLPTYTDFQFKTKTKINSHSDIIFTGIGAIDDFELNESVNENTTDSERIELNDYILNNIPTSSQWSYAVGSVYKHYKGNSIQTIVFSRNELNNKAEKYNDNDDSTEDNLLSRYESNEAETRFRFENATSTGNLNIKFGVNADHIDLSTQSIGYRSSSNGSERITTNTNLSFFNYGFFGSVSHNLFENRLKMNYGIRLDASSFSDKTSNPIDQFSPRIAASYSITEKFEFNTSAGLYYQLPPYTTMGYTDQNGTLLNKESLSYIQNFQTSTGFAFYPEPSTKLSIEGFYKKYSDYPYSLTDSVSLANLGSDFGVIGNDLIDSRSNGRAYGAEFSAQKKTTIGIFGILSYTYVISEFDGRTSEFISSSWDNRHILTTTLGKSIKGNWDLGLRWRYLSGRPYTPYDVEASSLKENWDVRGEGLLDYNKLNSERLSEFHQLDLRIDKNWYFEKWSLQLYIDIQNIYNFKSEEPDILNVRKDADGNLLTNPDDNTRYQTYFIKNDGGTILPSIGFILDF